MIMLLLDEIVLRPIGEGLFASINGKKLDEVGMWRQSGTSAAAASCNYFFFFGPTYLSVATQRHTDFKIFKQVVPRTVPGV